MTNKVRKRDELEEEIKVIGLNMKGRLIGRPASYFFALLYFSFISKHFSVPPAHDRISIFKPSVN